jgi:putative flippase GtrA
MLGLLVPILITIYVYKQAKETGRNPIIWSIINIAVIVGVQVLLGVALILILGLDGVEQNTLLVNLVAIAVSLLCSYLFVVRPVSRVSDAFIGQGPPPPPQF